MLIPSALIRTVVGVYPVDRTTACGRSGKDLQLSVSVCDERATAGRRPSWDGGGRQYGPATVSTQ
ncbi:hypothetical protein GBQ70_15785 [Halomicrobium sp. ZPS1]|uniref:Uncharacterized protein n=1 Tax=Halomicrobium mukohataei TaxID=57705 RepID=A0A4D6KLP1_9EURY|nr:hypothetical protein E5139_15765 [Halomicrobium mukohataei]QFR21841.1 hypothetical protein GBQ70_15785 [Halomicrobium sp. ZPS1]